MKMMQKRKTMKRMLKRETLKTRTQVNMVNLTIRRVKLKMEMTMTNMVNLMIRRVKLKTEMMTNMGS